MSAARSASQLVLRLYPRSWREHYGDEMGDLLAAIAPRWRDVADLVNGATGAHARARPTLLVWTAAVLALVVGEVVALRTGATRNVLWPPTTAYRAVLLVATFAPLIAAGRWRARTGRWWSTR